MLLFWRIDLSNSTTAIITFFKRGHTFTMLYSTYFNNNPNIWAKGGVEIHFWHRMQKNWNKSNRSAYIRLTDQTLPHSVVDWAPYMVIIDEHRIFSWNQINKSAISSHFLRYFWRVLAHCYRLDTQCPKPFIFSLFDL